MLHRWRLEIMGGCVLVACLIALAFMFFDRHLEYSYITYIYAQNFAAGRGLVSSLAGPPVLSGAVSPVYAILLAMGSLISRDLPELSNVIGILAVAAGGAVLYGIVAPAGKPSAIVAMVVFISFPLVWASLGLESSLWLAVGLAGVFAYNQQRGMLAAVLLAIMALIRLEGLILAVVILVDAFASRRPLRLAALGTFSGIVGLGLLVLLSSYPADRLLPTLPPSSLAGRLPDILGDNVLTGLANLLTSFWALSWVWIGVLPLIGLGAWQARRQRPLILLAGWAVLHLIVLGVLQVGVYAWTLVPLAPVLAVLAGAGCQFIGERLPAGAGRTAGWAMPVAIILWAAGQSAVWLAYGIPAQSTGWLALSGQRSDPALRPVADWLRTQTPAGATVGARGAGTLGYTSQRAMVDYYGSLQADLLRALGRGDGGWWILDRQPDYLVLSVSDVQNIDGYSSIADEWFSAHYLESVRFAGEGGQAIIVYQRTSAPRPQRGALISFVGYGGSLTLNGIATDFSLEPLEGGGLGLVRLEWLLDAPVAGQKTVSLRIRSGDGSLLAGLATRTVDFTHWPVRQLITTFHPIHVTEALPSGIYQIQVGIGADANHLDWKTVARAKIPFVGATDLGGISGAHTEFGDIELIGYRVGRRETGLEVLLLWQAIHAPTTDYRVTIQISDPNGVIVAQQAAEPYSGTYPTSVWSAGEQVTDSVVIDISALPAGEYDVTVGLLAPDDSRVLTVDGKDSVFVGRVNIEP